MIYPKRTEYLNEFKEFNLIPVFTEIQTDFETPVTIFQKAGANFLLESVESGENVGRFSMIGIGKKTEISLWGNQIIIKEFAKGRIISEKSEELDNPLDKIREYFKGFNFPTFEQLPAFFGGGIGYLGYETVKYFEKIPTKQDESGIPDGMMIIPEVLLVYDSVKRTTFIIVVTTPDNNYAELYDRAEIKIQQITQRFLKSLDYSDLGKKIEDKKIVISQQPSKEEFIQAVKKCKQYIVDGEIIQAVISRKINFKLDIPPFELYRRLRIINPSPYLYYLDFGEFFIIGSSPEVMVRVQGNELLLKPIAGTRPRGKSIDEDSRIARELCRDPKERAEHIMLVDLGRNDLGRVAVSGSVSVVNYMEVEKYSHVMHIVSTIKAELDKKYDIFDVIKATFPAGTLTGAPKIRAMEIINELESFKRGPYGGMIFNIGFNGRLDSCITIRTIVLKDKTASVQAGAGIVADSIPEFEYEESVNKSLALIRAVESNGISRE